MAGVKKAHKHGSLAGVLIQWGAVDDNAYFHYSIQQAFIALDAK